MPYQKYLQNIERYLYKYKFFDVKPNTIKDGQIFSPYPQFLHTGFEFKNDAEKLRYPCSIDPKKRKHYNEFELEQIRI